MSPISQPAMEKNVPNRELGTLEPDTFLLLFIERHARVALITGRIIGLVAVMAFGTFHDRCFGYMVAVGIRHIGSRLLGNCFQ